nr:MAG TPA: holin protein [Caudoviricetes sp.]
MDLTKIAELANPAVTALLGGSGIWAFAKTKADRNNNAAKLLLTVSRNQLIMLGRAYIERGYITMDEYEEYESEYQIYSDLGGNGLARRVFEQVDNLPMMPNGIDGRENR